MMTAVGSAGAGREWAARPSTFAGMGNQALMQTFLEEFRKAQAKSCERDVDEVRRSGMADRPDGKQEKARKEDRETFTF